MVSFSFEVVGPRGCFCDGSRVHLFSGSAKKSTKRLKNVLAGPRRPQAWTERVPKQRGPGWILGVGPNHRCEVHFLDIKAFPL